MKKIVIAILLCVCLSLEILAPALTVLAADIEKSYPVTSTVHMDENATILNETSLYNEHYSAEKTETPDMIELSKGEKKFVYHLGETYFEENSIFVTVTDTAFNISQYNWYAIEYFGGCIYVADVITNIDFPEEIGVVGAFIYPSGTYINSKNEMFNIDYATTNILEVMYIQDDFLTCCKIIAPIEDAFTNCIQECAEDFELDKKNKDNLSVTLIESFSFETKFKSSMFGTVETQELTEDDLQIGLMSLPNYGAYANSNKTVALNAYDKYTDYDKYINTYEEVYRNRVQTYYASGSNISVSDDPIVNIIPKNLFVSRGTYSYIGKEYGFYVKTVQDYGDDNYSDFIVFDIETVQPYPERPNDNSSPSVTISPLFSGTIRYIAGLGGVVVYEGYFDPDLALANIQVAGAINNINELNVGDTGYVANQDYGYAFCSFAYNAVGTGLNRDDKHINLGWAKTAVGAVKFLDNYVPGVGTIAAVCGKALVSGIELGANHYFESTRTDYTPMTQNADGTYSAGNITLGNSNTQTMINNYGNLVKGFETELLNSGRSKETEYPLLYKTQDHYFKVQYNFCQKDATVNWDSLVAISIALDIYYDGTESAWYLPDGEVEKRDSVIGGRVDYYNESPSNSEGGNITESTLYHTEFRKDPNGYRKHANETYTPLAGAYKDFYFTPNRTFTYVIETINRSQNADPYLKLYDNNGNLLAYNDDGGTKDSHSDSARNAKITITLTGGQTYRLRTLCYNFVAGYYEFFIRKSADLLESNSLSLHYNSTTVSGDAIWYKFTPAVSDFYTFYTVGSIDTYLTLYNDSYEQYAFNDDGGTGLNAQIDFYLFAGETYYLKANRYYMGSGTFDVFVNMQRIVQIDQLTKKSEYVYIFNANGANFFRFTPEVTRAYTFKTNCYEGDPYLQLYDETMDFLGYNDDNGDSSDALLTYTLEAGKTYYIKVRDFGSAAGYGKLYFMYG